MVHLMPAVVDVEVDLSVLLGSRLGQCIAVRFGAVR
jgi:hypothetical protein